MSNNKSWIRGLNFQLQSQEPAVPAFRRPGKRSLRPGDIVWINYIDDDRDRDPFGHFALVLNIIYEDPNDLEYWFPILAPITRRPRGDYMIMANEKTLSAPNTLVEGPMLVPYMRRRSNHNELFVFKNDCRNRESCLQVGRLFAVSADLIEAICMSINEETFRRVVVKVRQLDDARRLVMIEKKTIFKERMKMHVKVM